MTSHAEAPNHHAHHREFSGLFGVVAALSMVTGRGDAARLARELSGVAPGDLAVDIGCGPGAAARQAAGAGVTVIAVDPAPVMLRPRACSRGGRKRSGTSGLRRAAPARRRNGERGVVDRDRASLARYRRGATRGAARARAGKALRRDRAESGAGRARARESRLDRRPGRRVRRRVPRGVASKAYASKRTPAAGARCCASSRRPPRARRRRSSRRSRAIPTTLDEPHESPGRSRSLDLLRSVGIKLR